MTDHVDRQIKEELEKLILTNPKNIDFIKGLKALRSGKLSRIIPTIQHTLGYSSSTAHAYENGIRADEREKITIEILQHFTGFKVDYTEESGHYMMPKAHFENLMSTVKEIQIKDQA